MKSGPPNSTRPTHTPRGNTKIGSGTLPWVNGKGPDPKAKKKK